MIHPTAVIGEPPEHRAWAEGDPMWTPNIDPNADVAAFVTVDSGVFRPTTVGPHTWLMKHVHVGHDAIIGTNCELAPGTVICGEVEVGDGCKFGVNSCVKPQIKIGDGARIGMGAVVTKNVPAGETWVGNPARPIQYRETEREIWEQWWVDRALEVPVATRSTTAPRVR